MKKKLVAFLLALTACACVFGGTACEKDAPAGTIPTVSGGDSDLGGDTSDGGEEEPVVLEYEVWEDIGGEGCTVVGIGTATEVEHLDIPAMYNGVPVKIIGEDAFRDCKNLKSVTIPNSVKTIGKYAFLGCDGLTEVKIPDSVTKIGESAFRMCYDLTSVIIGDGLQEIGSYTFVRCTALTTVVIGSGVKTIKDHAFDECSAISTVYYKGTDMQWSNITMNIGANMNIARTARYYYSESAGESSTWHYVDGVPTPW